MSLLRYLPKAAISCCLLSLPLATIQAADDAATAAIERMRSDLTYIASDELEGRDSGSPGIRLAGDFIRQRYEELGMKTNTFGDSPYQHFTIPGGDNSDDPANQFSIVIDGETKTAVRGTDFTSLSIGNNAAFSGEVVFGGYGITADELNYDDYAGLDIQGKVVVVIRKEPQQLDQDSVFDGTRSSKHAYFTAKVINARKQGAAAMILINDRITAESDDGDRLLPVGGAGRISELGRVPTMQCTRAFIEPLLVSATGKTLKQLEDAIDADLKPQSQVLESCSATGETLVKSQPRDVNNLVAVMPGKGELAKEYVIVGAHYDHVGRGGAGSLARGSTAVHNGADDNGSGTVTILEVARRMSEHDADARRTIVFISFTGEEKGLLGSRHYVDNPRFPLDQTVAMVNLDMVGRLTDNTLLLYGTGTADTFSEMIDRINGDVGFELDIHPEGTGPSDHASFYRASMPVFHFFTGLHNEYHRPSDDVPLINFDGMQRIATMVTDVVKEVSTQAVRPQFIGPKSQRRAVLGVQISREDDDVVKLSAVTPDGPAANAGLEAGDVIVGIGDSSVGSLEELRSELSGKRPGKKVSVKYLRGEDEKVAELQLGSGE